VALTHTCLPFQGFAEVVLLLSRRMTDSVYTRPHSTCDFEQVKVSLILTERIPCGLFELVQPSCYPLSGELVGAPRMPD
jgi:hypothetical protein